MESEFIPYEQALALKELGFNEPCLASYDYAGEFKNPFDYNSEEQDGYVTNESLTNPDNFNASSNPLLLKMYVGSPFVAAPLYQQAFRWLFEKRGVKGCMILDDTLNDVLNENIKLLRKKNEQSK